MFNIYRGLWDSWENQWINFGYKNQENLTEYWEKILKPNKMICYSGKLK